MEALLKQILAENSIELNKIANNTIAKLIENAKIAELAKSVSGIKNQIIEIFDMYREKEEFKEKHLSIANANAKKEYDYTIDLQEFPNIAIKEIRNLATIGLQFDAETNRIFGTPTVANTVDLHLIFYNQIDENKSEDIKIIPFIVNADPKDLWLNKASDQGARYTKPDEAVFAGDFLDKKIVIASKRGRSHAHEGSFRDDDFCVRQLVDGWAIVAVADGAGSAKYARQGSKLATELMADSFANEEILKSLTADVVAYFTEKETTEETVLQTETEATQPEDEKLKYKSSIINALYKEVRNLHTQMIDFAKQEEINLKDLNTTLIFALCKKFDFGYVALTFGVGDCPINVVLNANQDVKLLNTLDVGEFGGGTRFITMPEIFNNPTMGSRFSINRFEDFDKLFLMTDGIYDPKFVTENKLEDVTIWTGFLQDLDGENEDKIKVDFVQNDGIEKKLLQWLDFWSKGNHDDRTLAIVY
ncbi:PP2C family serine/threonine-protein phosphatase [Parapedobacter sp. 2B3]|uniref:PP2C family serine/threonine-protein phosphatase n=1 Tax=Parapedobacter sp. 2B3 TaxID=3342381 RepID=UPI0035B57E8C